MEDVTMKYLKKYHLVDRILPAAAWAFWALTFSLGYLLAKVTF